MTLSSLEVVVSQQSLAGDSGSLTGKQDGVNVEAWGSCWNCLLGKEVGF